MTLDCHDLCVLGNVQDGVANEHVSIGHNSSLDLFGGPVPRAEQSGNDFAAVDIDPVSTLPELVDALAHGSRPLELEPHLVHRIEAPCGFYVD